MSDEVKKVFKRSSAVSLCPEKGLMLHALGRSIPVKKYGSTIMLHRSILEGPLSPSGLGSLFKGKKRASLLSSLDRPFISWNLLKVLLHSGLAVRMLRDMLNRYKAFQAYSPEDHADDDDRRLLSKDQLKLNGLLIPFKVARDAQVYLDILGAFTLIGRLKIAMCHEWREVDLILEGSQVPREEAFKLPQSSKKWYGNRSHITIQALHSLVNGLVLDEEKKKYLNRLLGHLVGEIEIIRGKWREMYEELESGVLAIQGKISDLELEKLDTSPKLDVKPGEVIGTESCDSACGRKYHFTLRCCNLNHALNLADKTVGYIVKDDQIFLDKCNSFSALGRMYVIRCSDYRKSDKILESSGMDPRQHYLLERRNYSKASPRNRRTHISLEAFITLVHMGFADSVKNTSLLESIKRIVDDVFVLKERCENYFRVSTTTEEEVTDEEDLTMNQEESGIESGTSSDASASGKNSPSSEDIDDAKEEEGATVAAKHGTKPRKRRSSSFQDLLGFQIRCRVEKSHLYIDLNSVFEYFFQESFRFIPKIKKLARKIPNLEYPFFPMYFKKSTDKFISANCLFFLIDNKCVQLLEHVSEEDLKTELKALNEKMITESEELAVRQSSSSFDEKENISSSYNSLEDSDSEDEDTLEIANLIFNAHDQSCISIMDLDVPFQVVNEVLYLDKKSIFQLLKLNSTGPHYRVYITVDRILEESNICLDDAFLYEGRKRSFISTKAFKVLIENDLLSNSESKDALLTRLTELESLKESLKTNRILNLKSFEPIPFKSCKNSVYVHTLQMMKVVGFSPSYVDNNPSKAYFTINKLLSQKGLNVETCFLRQGKSKYVYISLHAVLLLFQTEFGPFKDKEKLKIEIMEALKEHGLIHERKGNKRRAQSDHSITVGMEFPRLKYRIRNEMIYLHRKSLFEHLGLQKVIMSGSKGYAPINSILSNCGVDLEKAYLQSRQEKYSYISLEAVLLILDSQEPLMVCLQQRERFFTSLLLTIQGTIGGLLSSRGNEIVLAHEQKIPFKLFRNRVYLLRHTCYSLSGLYDKSSSFVNSEYDIYEYPAAPLIDRGLSSQDCFFPECGDEYAYISIDALLVLMNLDGDLANRSNSSVKPHWENIISAIDVEVPKLKVRVKMEEFRSHLIKYMINAYLECLRNPRDKSNRVELIDLVTETEDEDSLDDGPTQVKKVKVDDCELVQVPEKHNHIISLDEESMNTLEFDSIKAQILSNSQNGMIANWEVKRIDDELIRLVISPSYGSSRKMSFIHPDVSALLSYEFLIQQDLRFAFFINERKVPSELVKDIVDSVSESGILNLLYQLLTLRPCFGSFNPELVETVGKGLVDCSGNNVDNIENLCSQVVVDSNFIGSSQNGRTYAGTVRSQNCRVLADSRVSDTCSECADLNKLVINRSMLTDEALRMEESDGRSNSSKIEELKTLSSNTDSHQRSVWKIESTNALGCKFVCPQIQSFNSSPPYKFVGSYQATSIVVHKVEISSKLETRVTLNGREIHKTFEEFRRNKQVGRLLDQVASLRFCLGYPHAELVEGARYIIENKHLMNADVRKFFECITVDESFLAKMTSEDLDLKGTLRIKSCRYISGEFADLCDQCRLLQEPLEFLGV